MPGAIRSRKISAWLLLLFLANTTYAQIRIDLPAQSLGQSLTEVGTLGHLNIMFDPTVVEGLLAPALKAELSADDAVDKLLAGTKLHAVRVDSNTIRVVGSASQHAVNIRSPDASARHRSGNMHLADAAGLGSVEGQRSPTGAAGTLPGNSGGEQLATLPILEEIVITGTHLHGVEPISPMLTFDRTDIDRSGYATIQQFLRGMPQVFSGDVSESTVGGLAAPGQGSFALGTGINIHGLGSGSTLTLLNGHRLAPAGFGEYTDISMIPASAVDRVEVLTDGASAIYGSDAVGGVVNVILRDNFEGAETRLRYGSVTQGNSDERDIAQTLGTSFDHGRGNFLVTYDFYKRSALDASDRTYTQNAPTPTRLLPDQKRQSAFFSASEKFSDGVKVFGSGNYTQRNFDDSTTDNTDALATYQIGQMKQYGGTLGADITLADTWKSEVAASLDRSSSFSTQYSLPGLVEYSQIKNEFEVQTVDLSADGSLFALPAGNVNLAVGGQWRDESYHSSPAYYAADRRIAAAYSEADIPVIGEAHAIPGVRKLNLSAAIRYEHYSDFGAATNPRFGVAWVPVAGIRVRASLGRSFHAPTFDQLDDTNNGTLILPLPDPVLGGTTNTLLTGGRNSLLKPETARTWTAGFDLQPSLLEGFTAQATFFSTDFSNRIASPNGSVSLFNLLGQLSVLGPYGFRNPSQSLIQQYTSTPSFSNPYGISLDQVGAFINIQLQNLSSTVERGIDFDLNQKLSNSLGTWSLTLAGEYLTAFDRRLNAESPEISYLSTVFNPINLRLRSSFSWDHQWYGAGLVANFSNSYRDNRLPQVVDVASWTTFDANLHVVLSSHAWATPQTTKISLSIINMLNRDPPYIVDPINNLHFDGANATPLGRFWSVSASVKW